MTDAGEEGAQTIRPGCQPERVLLVPRAILGQTHDYFVPYWRARVEAACFWFGVDTETRQVVTTLAIPHLRQSWGHYRVDADSLRRLAAEMRAQGLVNLAQVHTHPSARVGHSPYDDENAYSTREGALSLVWPHYGAVLYHDLTGVGVHERRGGRWARLRDEDIGHRIRLVDSIADFRWAIMPDGTDDEH
jgi:hypothetical protein